MQRSQIRRSTPFRVVIHYHRKQAGSISTPYKQRRCPQLNDFSGVSMIDTKSIITSLLNDPDSGRYVIPGDPVAWMRAGVHNRRFYDQQRHEKFARGLHMTAQRKNRPTHLKALRLIIMFYMPMPRSWKSAKRELMNGKHVTTVPDNTNLAKFLEDVAVEVTLLRDDCLIASHLFDKIYDTNPRTEFILQEIE